jgi:hypothetical protein
LGDEVGHTLDEFDRSWAERPGVFERRTIRRELELVVMPGQDARALEVGDGGEGAHCHLRAAPGQSIGTV